jgi:hypothetical protein
MKYRWLAVLLLMGTPFLFVACVSTKVQVPVLLTPIEDATLEQLIEKINQFDSIRTLTARVDLQFQSDKEAEMGLSRRYRTAEGLLVMARPENIRLQIQIPIVKTKIAEMASDGTRFQVVVYPEEYRTFLQGRNDQAYIEKQAALARDPRGRKAGPFARIRPQHFTRAIMIDGVDLSVAETTVFLEENRQVEDDPRPNAPKRGRIIRSYYVVSVLSADSNNHAQLRRRYWFDRTEKLMLVREQVYEGQGRLVQDTSYGGFIRDPQFGGFLPTRIQISRPYDNYSVTVTVSPGTIKLNGEVPSQAFILQKPAEWGDSVETIDLDKISRTQ